MYCWKCGKEIPAQVKFCPYCGATQQQAKKPTPTPPKTEPQPTPVQTPPRAEPQPTPVQTPPRRTEPRPTPAQTSPKIEPQPTPEPAAPAPAEKAHAKKKRWWLIPLLIVLAALIAAGVYFAMPTLRSLLAAVQQKGNHAATAETAEAAATPEPTVTPSPTPDPAIQQTADLVTAYQAYQQQDYTTAETYYKKVSDEVLATYDPDSDQTSEKMPYFIAMFRYNGDALDAVAVWNYSGNTMSGSVIKTDGTLEEERECTYDEQTKKEIAETRKFYNEDGTPSSQNEFTLDADGNLLTESDYDGNGNYTGGTEYTYDDQGREATVSMLDANKTVYYYIEDVYNDAGQRVRQNINMSGEQVYYEYTFNEDGNIQVGTVYQLNGTKLYYVDYTYDDRGNLTLQEYHYVSGADYMEEVRTERTYDAEDQLLTEIGYDRNGNQLRSLAYTWQNGTMVASTDVLTGITERGYCAPLDLAKTYQAQAGSSQ